MISADKYRPAVNHPFLSKKHIGSAEYDSWWNEQYNRCINGYTPDGGTRMSGAYYFHTNFCNVDVFDTKINRKIVANPLYRDQDHEYFHEVEEAEKGGYGIILVKARRKGFSFNNVGLLSHEWSFYPNSVVAIGSEKEKYVNDFRDKVMKSYNRMHPQFRLKSFKRGKDGAFVSGYEEKEDGEWITKGFSSEMHFRIIKDENAFRGLSIKYMLVEEAGEVSKLKQLLLNSEECFREGTIQFGIPIIGGTSNQISHESMDFQDMFYNAKKYNLKSLFIPASKNYSGYFNFSTGKSDIKGAEEDIKKRAEAKRKTGKLAFYTFMQEMPLTPEDAFVSIGTGLLDLDKINGRKKFLLNNPDLINIKRGKLEWQRAKDGSQVIGSKPEFIEDIDGPFEILDLPDPKLQYQNVAAVDPYHTDDEYEEDGSNESGSKSKGCMYVYRRWLGVNTPGKIPFAKYIDRPDSKDVFAENCAKLACYTESEILAEANDSYFFKWFDNHNLMRYLKERPQSADAPTGKPTNRFGVNMQVYQKNYLKDLLQSYVKNDIDNIYFLSLLEDLAKFGTKNTDEAMAFGMCLMHDDDMVHVIARKEDSQETIKLFTFVRHADGKVTYMSGEKRSDGHTYGAKAPTLNYDL